MIVFLTQSAEVKKNPGSWSPSCLRGQPPRHSTLFPLKRYPALGPRNFNRVPARPHGGCGQGPKRTSAGPTFTLTFILTATGTQAAADSSRTQTALGTRFLQDRDSRDQDSHARPVTPTPGSVSARPGPSSGWVPTPGGKAAGPALREGPRGCQNFSYDNHLRVETRGLESQHFANPTYSRSHLDMRAPGSTHSHLGPLGLTGADQRELSDSPAFVLDFPILLPTRCLGF